VCIILGATIEITPTILYIYTYLNHPESTSMGNNVKSLGKAAQALAGNAMRVSRRVVTGPGSPADPGCLCWCHWCLACLPGAEHGTPCWVSWNYLLTEKAKVTLAPNKTLQYDQYFRDRATYEVKSIFFRWLCPNENGNRAITKHLELGCSLTYCQMVQPTVQHRVCHIPRNGSWIVSKRSMLEVWQQ